MGKSISSLNFAGASGNALVLTGAWIKGATAASTGTITVIKETGPRRYVVTDGTETGEVTLVETSSITEGQAYLQIGTSDVFVRQIYENVVTSSENSFMSWSLNSDKSDIFLPYSIKGAAPTSTTATINSESPDQLKQNTSGTVSFDYVDIAPTGANVSYENFYEASTLPGQAGLTLTASAGQVVAAVTAPTNTGNSPIKSYEIYAGSSATALSLATTLSEAGSYTLTGLAAGSTEYVRVNVANEIGTTEGAIQNVSLPNVPGAATVALTSGNAQVTVNVTAPTSDGGSPVTEYDVYEGTSADNLVKSKTLTEAGSFVITGLTNGITEYVRVDAVNAVGTTAGAVQTSIPATVPGKAGVTLTAGDSKVTVNVTAPTDTGGSPITEYDIYSGTAANSLTKIKAITTAGSFDITGLTNGTEEFVRVDAVNAVGTTQGDVNNATPTAS